MEMDATSPPTIAMDTAEEGGPINSLPEDLLRNIFEKFNSSWGPWVPWAPVGWSPPPPLTPKHLSVPNGGAQQDPERMELEEFNALRQNLCLVSKRWQCAAERCSSLWVDLFAATASQWHLKPARRPGTPQIFGCGKMTLSQRASVPLALRSADAPGIPIAAPPAGPEQEGAPLTIRGYLESWLRKHGPHLQRLSLAGCGAWVGDDELRLVADHCGSTLVCLDLCGCAQLSDEAVSDCLHRCTKLTMVSLAMMGQLSAEALRHYSPNAAAPESPSPLLRLQLGGEMMDEAAEEAARNQAERAAQLSATALAAAVPLPPPQLERLDLTGCGGIGWHGLDAALAGCGEGLQEFSLRGQVAMPADGIVSIVGRCPNLTQLDISCCLSIDDRAVTEIGERSPGLRTLAVSACPAIAMPPATVTALAAACPDLRTLSLAGCLELCPHETLPALLSKLPQLERLDLGHCTQFHPVHVCQAVHHVDTLTARTKLNDADRVTLRLSIPASADPRELPGWVAPPAAIEIVAGAL